MGIPRRSQFLTGIGEEKLDPGPSQHSMAGLRRTRTFPAFPSCGDLPVFPELPFSGPVAPCLDTFKAMSKDKRSCVGRVDANIYTRGYGATGLFTYMLK